jgi:hypothetical protein
VVLDVDGGGNPRKSGDGQAVAEGQHSQGFAAQPRSMIEIGGGWTILIQHGILPANGTTSSPDLRAFSPPPTLVMIREFHCR